MLNAVNVLYSQLLRENQTRERKQRHYPSGACAVAGGKFYGKCRRATWYEWMGVPRTDQIDAPGLFKMQVGDMIHEYLSDTLTRGLVDLGFEEQHLAGDGLGEEVAMVWQPEGFEFPFSGRLDKRFVHPEGMRVAVEWKSTYGRGADYIKRDGPKDENLLQCALYLEQDVFPVDAVILMYAARDSGYMFGYWITKHGDGLKVEHMGSTKVTFSPLGWPAIRQATLELEASLKSDEAPDRDYDGKDWHCDYCGHNKKCWGKL